MKKIYPQDCINKKCIKTIYVEKHQLGLPLQCSECVEKTLKRNEKENNKNS